MEELANALQVWQSATGMMAALAVFVVSTATGRQLAEDMVLRFAIGAVGGSTAPLMTTFLGIS